MQDNSCFGPSQINNFAQQNSNSIYPMFSEMAPSPYSMSNQV